MVGRAGIYQSHECVISLTLQQAVRRGQTEVLDLLRVWVSYNEGISKEWVGYFDGQTFLLAPTIYDLPESDRTILFEALRFEFPGCRLEIPSPICKELLDDG